MRLILPDTTTPPKDWQFLCKTLLRAVPIGAAITCVPVTAPAKATPISPAHPVWQDWINLHWQNYLNTHQATRPAKSPAEICALFAGSDLHGGNAFALFKGNRLLGFSSQRQGQTASPETSPPWAEFGWTGTTKNAPPNSYQTLIAAVIARAATLGFETIEFEADSTDPAAWAMLALLPSKGDSTTTTWQLSF